MDKDRDQPAWKASGVALDRTGGTTLVDQIAHHIRMAIAEGALPAGARLPSWRDLSAQLGVARGTVRAAYERLADQGLLVTAGSAGTRVSGSVPVSPVAVASEKDELLSEDFRDHSDQGRVFQMGVPAHDAFPATLWSRLHRQAVQATSLRTGHSDPRGLPELRAALAAHVAIARGIECSPEQIIVTAGFRGGLGVALCAIGASGRQAWVEDPGYPVTRRALEVSGVHPVAVPVDGHGLVVGQGRAAAPLAVLAVVTPGQQAPSGVALARHRRLELLQWAGRSGAWIVEDDYLAELHLSGRPAPALASGQGADRVIYIGSFSKTISPITGIGFMVAPPPLTRRLIEVTACLGASPNAAAQLAIARFLQEGHYLRHLRRMRHLYAQRQKCLLDTLAQLGVGSAVAAGLSVLLPLPNGFDDQRLAREALVAGFGPAPLSPWFSRASRPYSGLILGVANVIEKKIEGDCRRLLAMTGDPSGIVGRATLPASLRPEPHGTPER